MDDLTAEGYVLVGNEWMKVTVVADEVTPLVNILVAQFSPTTGRRMEDKEKTVTAASLALRYTALTHELEQVKEILAAIRAVEEE